MSWFFGILHDNISYEKMEQFSAIHTVPIHTIKRNNFYLTAGGIDETCFCGSMDENTENGFWVVGVGIKRNTTDSTIFSNSDWKNILSTVTEFYNGKRELANVIDWWLAFELWRQSLKRNT